MSSPSISSFSHSSSSDNSINSSILDLKRITDDNQDQYLDLRKKLNLLEKKGKEEKEKITENKKKNIDKRKNFISYKQKEKHKLFNSCKTTKKEPKKESQNEKGKIECKKCNKIMKAKNFFYHDSFIHDGENITLNQRKRALKTFIKKKLKKVDIIYSEIMNNAKRLKISTVNFPELKHVEKIGFHVIRFNEKKSAK